MAQATLTDEKPLPLAEAARLLPKRPNPATLWRWRTRGIRGVRLQTLMIGGRRHVLPSALRQFIEAVTAAPSGRPNGETDDRSPEAKRQRSPEMSRRLRQAGLSK
jgi:hypothetical protein